MTFQFTYIKIKPSFLLLLLFTISTSLYAQDTEEYRTKSPKKRTGVEGMFMFGTRINLNYIKLGLLKSNWRKWEYSGGIVLFRYSKRYNYGSLYFQTLYNYGNMFRKKMKFHVGGTLEFSVCEYKTKNKKKEFFRQYVLGPEFLLSHEIDYELAPKFRLTLNTAFGYGNGLFMREEPYPGPGERVGGYFEYRISYGLKYFF